MKTLSIDIETYSSVDLTKSGVYKYVESPDFEILLLAYAYGGESVRLIDIAAGESLPAALLNGLVDPAVIKTAFNAAFEITCINKYLSLTGDRRLDAASWCCTMVYGYYLGLSGGLAAMSKAMNLNCEKDAAGKSLIKYFSGPCKPTKINGGRTRNLHFHNTEKWEAFKNYCKQDVEVERTLRNKFCDLYEIPDFEQKLWTLDQKINAAGISVNAQMIDKAIMCDSLQTEKLISEAVKLTGIENPNSKAQIKRWLYTHEGISVDSLTKETIAEIQDKVLSNEAKRLLDIVKSISKTSVAKYKTMREYKCLDDRVRGLFQFYGASRTGRWAGRAVQMHNLPKNGMPDLDAAREFLLSGDYEAIDLLYPSVANVLSELIRTAFIPKEGCKFLVTDFSAIEARIIAWLAGEQWRLDVFNSHGKIYEASAAQMFKVPIGTITKGSPLRQKGKVAELALGYQGGVSALIRMGALAMGLTEEELPELVNAWRTANPHIKRLWKLVEASAVKAVEQKSIVKLTKGLTFEYRNKNLIITLPSGRKLCYLNAEIAEGGKFLNKIVKFSVMAPSGNGLIKEETYGGKLVENIVQAIARDCLAVAMVRLDAAGYRIVMHVHDEAVLEIPEKKECLTDINSIMAAPIDWAEGLLLKGDSFETMYYKKD